MNKQTLDLIISAAGVTPTIIVGSIEVGMKIFKALQGLKPGDSFDVKIHELETDTFATLKRTEDKVAAYSKLHPELGL